MLQRPLERNNIRTLAPNSLLDICAVETLLTGRKINSRHMRTLYTHLFRKGVTDLSQIELGAKARKLLTDNFVQTTSKVMEVKWSDDGKGAKLVIQLADGLIVETVIINHSHRSSGRERKTVCVSSQVGCAMGCKFCATGTMGLRANLTAGEILEQVWHCRELVGDIRNVVFMGMGEPLDNYEEMLAALNGLTHQTMFDLGFDKITVSTVGITPRIQQLALDCPQVNLALSLHAVDQGLRESIIPTANRFSVEDLGETLTYYHDKTKKKVMIEYIVLGGVNDKLEHAHGLGRFCKDRDTLVNLIPYNPTDIGTIHGYQVPEHDTVQAFADLLDKEYGVHVKVRWSSSKGRDVDGACGQLVVEQQPKRTKLQ